MALNKNQRIATNFLKNRENVFLSGEGGTGKSYVIDNFTDYLTKNGIKFLESNGKKNPEYIACGGKYTLSPLTIFNILSCQISLAFPKS